MLQVSDLTVQYGSCRAVKDIHLSVQEGELVVLLGSNGSGKSTVFRAISGLVKPTAGQIQFDGKNLTGLPAHAVVKLGVSQCPEGRLLFPQLSVLKNLTLGAYTQRKNSVSVKQALEQVFSLFPVLLEKKYQLAGSLSGGQQQMVAIGRALMARPRLLLLDEPSLGLAPLVVDQMLQAIEEINRRGTMVLLAEQNAHAALRIAHRVYVINSGRIVLEGSRDEMLGNERVKEAYLGI